MVTVADWAPSLARPVRRGWRRLLTPRALGWAVAGSGVWLVGAAIATPFYTCAATPLAASAAGLAVLVPAALLLRYGALRREAWRQNHERRLSQLAVATEQLLRLRDPREIAARAAPMTCRVLGCVEAIVTLGPAAAPAADEPHWLAVSLTSGAGETLGRLRVRNPPRQTFGSADRVMLQKVARAIASALETAGLLAEAVRARSEVELILGTISDGMFVIDRGWRVRYVNAAALRYLQSRREEMQGAVLWECFPGLRESEFGGRLLFAMATGQDVSVSAAYAPLSAWYEMRCYPFGGGITVYFRDISAQRETEEKLRQSQKLEALGQLTGGIAHDVNNLLTVILGNFEMLAMSAEERAEAGAPDLGLAEAGLRAGESASQLMHRLLAFSRRQLLSPRVLDVGELLSSLEPLLRRTLGEPIALRIDWPAWLWRALVDPAELENAILNLAINARDAMPAGGQLRIEAANVQIDRVYAASAGLDRTGDFIVLTVADTGLGMAREVLARAFDPFFTTKEPGRGTGLGLSMVYGFAKQSGGHAMIDSEPEQGTVIRLYLPRTCDDETAAPPVAGRVAARGSETILLVEDNDLVRAHTEAMLEGLGYTVLAAAAGPEALRRLRSGLRPDLLLTDVVLPGGMTGREVAEASAELVPELRVLFTSGYAGNALLENGRVGSGIALIDKPFRRAELAARIRTQLACPPFAAAARVDAAPDDRASWHA